MGKFIGEVIRIHAAPLSFPVLDEAEAYEDGGSKSFAASFLLDPNDERHAAVYAKIESECERAIDEAWGGKRPAKLKVEFYGEGNDRTNAQSGEVYKGYEDMQWVTGKCREDSPPLLVDKQKKEVPQERILKMFYAGVICNATINVYVGPTGYGPRLCCGLRTIMCLERGTPLGSGATTKEFDDFDADDGDVGAPEDDGLGDDQDIPF